MFFSENDYLCNITKKTTMEKRFNSNYVTNNPRRWTQIIWCR